MTRSTAAPTTVSRMRRAAVGVLLGLCLLAGLSPRAGAVSASPLVVTRTADDTKPGSLRAAIAAATSAGGTVTFAIPATDPGVVNGYATITLSLGPLVIPSSLNITGPAAPATPVAVSGPPHTGGDGTPDKNSSRVFSVTGGTVALSNLLIEFGTASPDNQVYPEPEGGGGILNTAGLTLTNCVLTQNLAGDALDPGEGNGINNSGAGASLSLINCTIEFNISQVADGGGGIANSGTLTAGGCSILNNQCNTSGGGLSNSGMATLSGCTIAGNQSTSYKGGGGGVYNSGTLTLSACTFTGNGNGGTMSQGGGLWNAGSSTLNGCTLGGNNSGSYYGQGGGLSNNGSLTMNACTLSGNSAGGFDGRGGGLSNTSTASAQITNCLFVQNTAPYAGGMINSGALTLINSTFAGNTTTSPSGPFNANGLYSGPATLLNDIFYFDITTTTGTPVISEIVAASGTAGPTVTHSDVQGGYAGTGNISLDPQFVQNPVPATFQVPAAPGDEHLKLTAPVVHAGANGPGVPPADIEGKPRPTPPATPSMGAYEAPVGTGFSAVGGFLVTGTQGQSTGSQIVAEFLPGATAAAGFTAAIKFGDGSAPVAGTISPDPNAAGVLDVTGSHTYTSPGPFTVTVTISGSGGTPTATVTSSATIQPILASLTFPASVPCGTVVAARVGLSGVTSSDVVVGLSSSDSSVVRLSRAVIVSAGSSSWGFSINTYRSHATKTVTITATLGAVTLTKDLTIVGR